MLHTEINIKKEKWEVLNDKDVWLYTIHNNNGSSITISNYGCIVQSLKIKNKDGDLTDVTLGYDRLEDYIQDEYFFGCVVGRCANRINTGKVDIDGIKYSLSVNTSGFHIHGGREGFNKKIWTVVEGGQSYLRLHYKSVDGEEGYPGNLDVWVNYFFNDDNTWTVEYEAKTDKATLVNLTHHAYFNLCGHNYGTIENHELRINAKKYLPVNEKQIPVGKLMPVYNTPFDFTASEIIGKRISDNDEQLILSRGYDHSWILEEKHTGILKHAASLRCYKTGIELDVFTTEPCVHFYSGNFIEQTKGKNHSHYYKRSGLCFETQHFPDTPNHETFPGILLEPGKCFNSRTVFKFSTF